MDADRRAFVKVALAATVAGMAEATAGASRGSGREPALPLVDGELRIDEATRAVAADDFGHMLHRTPEAVLLPASDHDVTSTLRWAAAGGRGVAPQGQSHSVYGRAQVHRGVVIDMTSLRTIHEVASDRVVVDAGAKWSEVLAATLPRGLTPPVLTDYLELSVGGTLVVGGVGGTTSRFGVQSDQVLAMDVITGTGRTVRCSPHRHPDLFDAVRAGLGQVGVIARATLALVPAPQQVRRVLLFYADLRTMLQDQRLLAEDDRFDAVQGAVLANPNGGWLFRLDAVAGFSGRATGRSGAARRPVR